MGHRPEIHITSTFVTTTLFRGNRRLLLASIPYAAAIVLLKVIIDSTSWDELQLSPLLTAAVSAEVFIVGFMLAGTTSDFKEGERLPGEIAASLETMADECLITWRDIRLAESRACLEQLVEVGRSIRGWLLADKGLDDVMADLRRLNDPFQVMAPRIQAGFTTRLKGEQHNIRRLVLRMDTMRKTSYISAGYLLAEVTAAVLFVVMLCTDLGDRVATLALVGLISYLLVYLVSLIRDLDNPFEYRDGQPGAADVDLGVLVRSEARLQEVLALMSGEPAPAGSYGAVGSATSPPTKTVTAAVAAVAAAAGGQVDGSPLVSGDVAGGDDPGDPGA
jgi:hypothetical protein